MRILGIDPGIAIVGFGVVDSDRGKHSFVRCGVITTPAGTSLSSRLDRIYADMGEVIRTFKPDVAAIEELFFNTNTKTAIMVGQARGVAILACANSGLPVYEYTPLQIKQGLVGYGRAEKKQVQEMVKTILSLKSVPKPDDTADALAAAICCGHSANYRNRFENKL